MVKRTESRFSKHLPTNKNYLELFFAYFWYFQQIYLWQKKQTKKPRSCPAILWFIVPHMAAQDRSFLSFLHI